MQFTRNFLAVVLAVSISLSSISAQKHLIKAERQFELKAFNLAIENAKKEIEQDPSCIDCHRLVAESFRMMNNNVDAAIWYRKMERFPNLPSDYAFNYGLLLKRMGQYDKAKKYFKEYRIISEETGEYFAQSCDFAKETLSAKKDFELNLFGVSSRYTDFGPAIFEDKIVFSSFRPDFHRNLDKKNTSLIQNQKCQFFIADNDFKSSVDDINFLLSDNRESFDMGAIHYAASAPICAVTKHNFKDGEKQIFANDLELSLYLAKVNFNGSFKDLVPFPHNEVGYATGFGTLNPSGNILYFSSNRPGGEGGFDIYASYFKDGEWTYPTNLGKKVNSPGNEITPFFDGETLFYSSDYTTGLGGFDVFKTSVNSGAWKTPKNMGNGVNSPEDDYYFTKHPISESYYLTSNRLGGRGSHDIYLVNRIQTQEVALDLAYDETVPRAVNLDQDLVVMDENPTAKAVNFELESDISIATIPETKTPTVKVPTTTSRTSTQDNVNETAEKVDTENKVIDFNKLLPPKAVDLNSTNSKSISLAGAKRVAYGEVIRSSSNVYFIQLAALFRSEANLNEFFNLSEYGSIYKVKQSNATKVKLGYFLDEYQAKEVLRQVKASGHRDAFITYEVLNTSRMELVTVSDTNSSKVRNSNFRTDETTGTNYKIRLASYEDPIWFDISKVNDIGVIEQWSKGEWTIFVLSGYSSMEEAEVARVAAMNRGFPDAKVVLDRNGVLEKLD